MLLIVCGFAVLSTPAFAQTLITANARADELREQCTALQRVWTLKAIINNQSPNPSQIEALSRDSVPGTKCAAYIEGVEDALSALISTDFPDSTLRERIAVVQKYLEAHPEQWHLQAATVVIEAFDDAYPPASARVAKKNKLKSQ